MRLKSFFAPTLQAAMAEVRRAMGDDAIIVATAEEEGGVRITVAHDELIANAPAPAPSAANIPITNLDALDDDIIDEIADALYRHGTQAALAEKLVASATRHSTNSASAALVAALDSVLNFQPVATGKLVLLIGPPGAGKTAMIGKLAARAALAGTKTALLTTDLERAGGVAQLQTYASSLKLPLIEVEDAPALVGALTLHQADLTLVDSTGRNPFAPDDAQILHALCKAVTTHGGSVVLVLPAGMDAAEATELAAAFKQLGASQLLVTRLDMTRRLGSILAISHDARLPLCAASLSPSIAAGLMDLNPSYLASKLLGTATSTTATQQSTSQTTPQSTPTTAANYGKR